MRGDPVSKTNQTPKDCEYDFAGTGELLRVTEHGGALIYKEHSASSVFGIGMPVRLTVLKSAHLTLHQETPFAASCEVWEACPRVSQLFLVFKVGGPSCPSPLSEVRAESQQG